MSRNLKRVLSVILGAALFISVIPVALLLRKGNPDVPQNIPLNVGAMPAGTEYISMPITIRDFAADGMLFEFNQFEKPGEYYTAGATEYNGLNAYFSAASWAERKDTDQTGDNVVNGEKQCDGYVRYYPDNKGVKLTFDLRGLNNGGNFARQDVDVVIIKFRTSLAADATDSSGNAVYGKFFKTTDTKGNTYNPAYPFVAHRGPDAKITDPVDSSAAKMYQIKEMNNASDDGKSVLTDWEKMVGNKTDWQYAKVSLGNSHPDGSDSKNDEVYYISMYINQKQGHVDFGGMWVFDTNANAADFRKGGYVYGTNEYYLGDNKGYGMLMTDDNDYYNCLPSTSNQIAGSNLYINGSWGDTTEPSAITAALNSGTKQYVHGAVIRTNLVEAYLDKDGKPVYTDATITYLQGLLKKTLPVAWERNPEHGGKVAYNLYHVMGVKLYDDNCEYVGPGSASATKDLAQVLREKINGNEGTLEETKAKAAAGNLTVPTDISSYYDAAYFLLHNTWRDSAQDATSNDGYGMPISAYNKLNLIETTNSKGEKCYVFNSGYDAAVYDITSGSIYNSQVTKMTKVQDTTVHSTGIIRGMTMPEYRFDPLNSLGYGKSGNIYAAAGQRDDQWKDTYYANTNYNLSLEGHAQFIYYQDANQYFTFTGDDDVYLYINGTRVLDVGAAHSISKVSINLNDLAKTLGLVDGQVYDFDFFYMERHGTAANFGVETNIQIVDPAMITTKTGYQNGLNTGYNGFVNADEPMVYEFALQNKGTEDIKDLTFTDDTIGVALTKDAITLNSANKSPTLITDLSLTLYNSEGNVKSYVPAGSLTENVLKQYLASGLAVGEKLVIYGFKYTITSDEWQTRTLSDGSNSNAYFYNIVNTTATSASGRNVAGVSHWVVQKRKANYDDIHLYTWGNMDTASADKTKLKDGGSVELYRSELADVIKKAAGSDALTGNETIQISNATGITDKTQTTNINAKATVANSTITYQATNTGADIYYVMVGTHGPIRVAVYTYGVADSTFVLDYNLPVRLTSNALNSHSVVDIAGQNPFGTACSITEGSETSNYGSFTMEGDGFIYSMSKIMNGNDTQNVTLTVREKGTQGEITKFNGVVMPKSIVVAPASVMYYEENFVGDGALVYLNADESWVQYGSGSNYQSADQNMNYGYDPNYSVDKVAPAGLQGDASNGTIRVHTVGDGVYDLMKFSFVGTGFEILSRTTDLDYCIMRVDVKDSNGNSVRTFPVICESENGDLYQVPVISVTGLDYGTYTVTLAVSNNASETNTPKVYMDGVRIYSPLSDDLEKLYYSSDEAKATITEVKKLIKDGYVVYAAKASDDNYTLAVGDTAIENYDGTDGFVLKEHVDLDEYLNNGPNNELYLDGQNSGFSVIAFYVTANPNCSDDERSIQIGVHRKTDSIFGNKTENSDYVTFVYGSNPEALTNGYFSTKVQSGTEQYYSIDISNLEVDDQGRYLVIIGMSSNNVNGLMPVLSITNLKLSGFTLTEFDLELQNVQGNE